MPTMPYTEPRGSHAHGSAQPPSIVDRPSLPQADPTVLWPRLMRRTPALVITTSNPGSLPLPSSLGVTVTVHGSFYLVLHGVGESIASRAIPKVVASFMMMQTLNKAGFQAFSMSIPSVGELFQIFEIAAPVFVTMTSKGDFSNNVKATLVTTRFQLLGGSFYHTCN